MLSFQVFFILINKCKKMNPLNNIIAEVKVENQLKIRERFKSTKMPIYNVN